MEPAQPMTTHGVTGVCVCGGGQGITLTGGPANAVSTGSQPVARGTVPHGVAATALTAFIGIVDGAKKSIAPINMVLTILRSFICRPGLSVFQPFVRTAAGLGWYGIGIQYSKPHVQASAVVSSRWSRNPATKAERTIDPAQPITIHGTTGVWCPVGQGRGTRVERPAKAVSAGSHVTLNPQGKVVRTCALAGIGIVDGAKKSIAPISM